MRELDITKKGDNQKKGKGDGSLLMRPKHMTYEDSPLEKESNPNLVKSAANLRNLDDERILRYYNDRDNPEYFDVEQSIIDGGMTIQDFANEFKKDLDRRVPLGIKQSNPMELNFNEEIPSMYDFKNSAFDDFTTSFSNGLKRVQKGIKMLPTMATAITADDAWADEWAEEVADWYEASSHRVSDLAGQSFFDTGSLRSFAGGMGSGLASLAPQLLRVVDLVPGLQGVGTLLATSGSFGDIYGGIVENGLENGLSIQEASMQGLLVGLPVAAIEKIGFEKLLAQSMATNLSGGFTKEFLANSIKEISKNGVTKETLKTFIKKGTKDLGLKQFAKSKAIGVGKGFVRGALPEGVSEGIQSFIENVGEIAYDNLNKHDKTFYGTDIKSKDFWKGVGEEAFYGAIIGGGMSASTNLPGKVKHESAYHYVRSSVASGDMSKIDQIKNFSQKAEASGDITAKERVNFERTIDEMVELEKDIWHNVSDSKARYQSYNMNKTNKDLDAVMSSEVYGKMKTSNPESTQELTEKIKSVREKISNVISSISKTNSVQTLSDDSSSIINEIDAINKDLPDSQKIDKMAIQEAFREASSLKNKELKIKKKLFKKQQHSKAKGKKVKNPIKEEDLKEEEKAFQNLLRNSVGLKELVYYDNNGSKVTNAAIEGIRIVEDVVSTYNDGKRTDKQKKSIELLAKTQYGMTLSELEELVVNKDELLEKYEKEELESGDEIVKEQEVDSLTNEYNDKATKQGRKTQIKAILKEDYDVDVDKPKAKKTTVKGKPKTVVSDAVKPFVKLAEDEVTDKGFDMIQKKIDDSDLSPEDKITATDELIKLREDKVSKSIDAKDSTTESTKEPEDVVSGERVVEDKESSKEDPLTKKLKADEIKEISSIEKGTDMFGAVEYASSSGIFSDNYEDTLSQVKKKYSDKIAKSKEEITKKDIKEFKDLLNAEEKVDLIEGGYALEVRPYSALENSREDAKSVLFKLLEYFSENKNAKKYFEGGILRNIEGSSVFSSINIYKDILKGSGYYNSESIIDGGIYTSLEEKIIRGVINDNKTIDEILSALESTTQQTSEAEATPTSIEVNNKGEVKKNYEVENATTPKAEDTRTQEQIDQDEYDAIAALHGKDQRVSPIENTNDALASQTISSNPYLYSQIKAWAKKVFPNLSIEEVNDLGKKYGADILGTVTAEGIKISKDKAFQTTLLHELAHIYLDVLGPNSPIVIKGLELIEGTQYFEDAKMLYPDKTKAEQLEEALVQSIAVKSVSELNTMLNGSTLDKFVAWLKAFWNKIKSSLGKADANSISELLSRSLAIQNSPIVYSNLAMSEKHDRYLDPKEMHLNRALQRGIMTAKINAIIDGTKIDLSDVQELAKTMVFGYYKRFVQENTQDIPDAQKMFNNKGLSYNPELKGMAALNNFQKQLQDKAPSLYGNIIKSAEGISRKTVDSDTLFKDQDDKNQDDPSESSRNDVVVKKEMSASLRSVLTTILDEKYNVVNKDQIMQYVASVGSSTFGHKQFMDKIQADAFNKEHTNIIALRLYDLFNYYKDKEGNVNNSFITELSSLVQIKYVKLFQHKGIFKKKALNTSFGVQTSSIINNIMELRKNPKYEIDGEVYLQNSFVNKIGKYKSLYAALKRNTYNTLDEIDQDAIQYIFSKVYGSPYSKENISSLGDKQIGNTLYAIHDAYSAKTQKEVSELIKDKNKSIIEKFVNANSDSTPIDNMFINSKGSMVASTRFGFWLSEFNKRVKHDKNYVSELSKSPVYEKNAVLEFFKNQKNVDWHVFDAYQDVDSNGKVKEYSDLNSNELLMLDLAEYVSQKDVYNQRIGITGDRTHKTRVLVPKASSLNDVNESIKNYLDHVNHQYKNFSDEKKSQLETYLPRLSLVKFENGKFVWDKEAHKAEVENIKDRLPEGINEKFGKDSKGELKIPDLGYEVHNYVANEVINRNYLTDLYLGVGSFLGSLKAGVANITKRLSGTNSSMTKLEIDKPVVTVVLDIPSSRYDGELSSDSFSWNGYGLQQRIVQQQGALNVAGANVKDQLFQVNENGELEYLKMSSIGLMSNQKGEHNLYDMGNDFYAKIGDALIDLEKRLQDSGRDVYIKIVDSKAIKAADVFGEAINYNQFLENSKTESGLDAILSKSNEIVFENYGSAFNINKDLSKVPLSEQEVIVSTQLAKIILNDKEFAEITDFEGNIVSILKETMRINPGKSYQESGVYQTLLDSNQFFKDLTSKSDDSRGGWVSDLMEDLYNDAVENNNVDNFTFDHPNLKAIVESFIASKLEKKGIKAKIPGNYLHMLPDVGSKLRFYEDMNEDGSLPLDEKGRAMVAEVLLPWSMFVQLKDGETHKEARARAESLLKTNPDIFKNVDVRVPASAEMSIFTAKVVGFTDGKTNTAIVPDGFVVASDGDHDADKVFVYRAELDEDSNLKKNKNGGPSKRNELFDKMFDYASSPAMVKGTKTTLALDRLAVLADKVFGTDSSKSDLRTPTDIAIKSEQMSFGGQAIGRFAIAAKLMSMLHQSNETLKSETFSIKKSGEVITFNPSDYVDNFNFTTDNLNDLAILLQGALDMGKDPVINDLKVTRENINVLTTMLMLNIKLDDAIGKIANTSSMEYMFFEKVSKDIASLIPIIKMDNSSPQNAVNLKLVEEAFDKVESNQLVFNTKNFAKRPLLVHYSEMLKLQDSVFKDKLAVSSNQVFDYHKQLKEYGLNITKNDLDRALYHMASQSLLPNTVKNLNGLEVDYMLQNLINEVEFIKYGVDGASNLFKPNNAMGTIDVKAIAKFADAITKGEESFANLKEEYKKLWKADLDGVLSDIKRYMDFSDSSDLDSYKDNKFIQILESGTTSQLKEEGLKILKIKEEFKNMQPALKNEIKEDFDKLPVEMKKRFTYYQMFTSGVEQKINSITEIMPMHSQKEYASKVKKFIFDSMLDRSKDSILTRNLITYFANTKPPISRDYNIIERDSGNLIEAKMKAGTYVINNHHFYNGKYFVKFGSEKNYITSELYDMNMAEIKNELKNNC